MPGRITRTISYEDWENGRAIRRAVVDEITGGRVLRRAAGHRRKDDLLRQLNGGERGGRFVEFEPPTPL